MDQVGSLLVSADQAVSGSRGLVDALIAIPAGQRNNNKTHKPTTVNTHQSPSGILVMAGLKQ